jgi:D-aspartate ligase
MRLNDVSLPVLVLGMDNHGALCVMRSLGRLGVRVYGVHSNARSSGARSKYCRGVFPWNLETAPAGESIDFLVALARKIGSRPLLLATNDESAIFISQNASRLRNSYAFPGNSPELIRSLYNKRELYHLANQLSPLRKQSFPTHGSMWWTTAGAHVFRWC